VTAPDVSHRLEIAHLHGIENIGHLASKDVDGIAITHGTDTLEETSYFLQLVTKSDKPVVLTGSMRPSTAMSADGPLNIYNAVAIAGDPKARGRGVLVAIDDDIHSAHDVIKRHSTDVATFTSGEAGLVGVTLFGKNTWYRTPVQVHTTKSEFSVAPDQTTLPRVDIQRMIPSGRINRYSESKFSPL